MGTRALGLAVHEPAVSLADSALQFYLFKSDTKSDVVIPFTRV